MDKQSLFPRLSALHSNPFLHKWKYPLNIGLFILVAFLAIFLGITAYHKGQQQQYENETMMKKHILCNINPQNFTQAGFPMMKLSHSSSNINNNECDYANTLHTETLTFSKLSTSNTVYTMQLYSLYAQEFLRDAGSGSKYLHITKASIPLTIHSQPALLLEINFSTTKYNHRHQLVTLPSESMCVLFNVGILYELDFTPTVLRSPAIHDSDICTASLVELANKVSPSLSQ